MCLQPSEFTMAKTIGLISSLALTQDMPFCQLQQLQSLHHGFTLMHPIFSTVLSFGESMCSACCHQCFHSNWMYCGVTSLHCIPIPATKVEWPLHFTGMVTSL